MKVNASQEIITRQIKSLNTQRSDIDVLSKVQSNFLQRFFKYNLGDYFPDMFLNIYEDVYPKNIVNKKHKNIAINLFIAARNFSIQQFTQKTSNFYTQRSQSISSGELPYCFRYLYCNNKFQQKVIKQGQLILFEVKIRAQVQKIQQFPLQIVNSLNCFKQTPNQLNQSLSSLQQILLNYDQQYFNIFLVYYGDSNFDNFNTNNYQKLQKIKVGGQTFKCRIIVHFISRQALIESFRSINKISNLEYINDLVIQFYQKRRQKQRKKRNREGVYIKFDSSHIKRNQKIYLATMAAVAIFGVGALFAVKKVF